MLEKIYAIFCEAEVSKRLPISIPHNFLAIYLILIDSYLICYWFFSYHFSISSTNQIKLVDLEITWGTRNIFIVVTALNYTTCDICSNTQIISVPSQTFSCFYKVIITIVFKINFLSTPWTPAGKFGFYKPLSFTNLSFLHRALEGKNSTIKLMMEMLHKLLQLFRLMHSQAIANNDNTRQVL